MTSNSKLGILRATKIYRKIKENMSYHGILWEEGAGGGWSAESEPSMTTIGTEVRCEVSGELGASQLEHSLSGEKFPENF